MNTASPSREQVATRVSAVSIAGNTALSLFKLLAGILAHSGAMVSDAVHSASDVLASFIVILGVKPWLVQPVLDEIAPALSGKLLLSLAAGIPSAQMAPWLAGTGVRAAYTVIPNLAAEIGESMTFATAVLGEEDGLVLSLFDKLGKTLIVDEKRLEAGMMVASCGTAFALRYARAAMEGGVQLGLYPREALAAVYQTMKGAVDLAAAHAAHPEAEIDRVTTPGGITIRGLNAMEEAGFTAAVVAGLKAYKN